MNAAAHTHPVYSLRVVGTEHAHSLLTASTDGKLCSWDADKLTAPVETMELKEHREPRDVQNKQGKAVAVTSMAFPNAASGQKPYHPARLLFLLSSFTD